MILAAEPRTPVTVVAGPGKAALLEHLASDPALARVVVLTAGRRGLVADQPPEGGSPFPLGCVCCTVQGDLQRSLRALLPRARRGDVAHVLVDAEAGSDPLAVLTTLITDPVLAAVYRIGGVVAAVDGPDHDSAARRLIQLADRVVLLCGHGEAVRGINPACTVSEGLPDARLVLEQNRFTSVAAATDTVVTMTLPDPVDLASVAHRLNASVLHPSSAHGVQRLFGVLQVTGESRPVAVDAVRHYLAPPYLLPPWPLSYTPRSCLVFVGTHLDGASIRAALARP